MSSDTTPEKDPAPAADPNEAASARPVLSIVRGDPSPEELAALVAVLGAGGGSDSGQQPAGPAPWSRPEAMFRRPMPSPGPDAWIQAIR
ncbi:MAG: acyl-CoA carboxylase subunit epsilon [Actinomycetes bacterium]